MLREVPKYERPREKASKYGISSLSNIELLAIILRTGTKQDNVIEVSKKLLYSFERLSLLKDITINELIKISGIGEAKAISILASIELGIRIIHDSNLSKSYSSPEAVFKYFYPILKMKTKECLYALYLDTKGNLIKDQLITQGTINSSLVDGKDIFKWALKYSASAIILVHNHPSGDPTPSVEDLKSTKNLVSMAKMMDLVILDHVIIGDYFFSMKKDSKYFKVF